jgi:hypothetical protein
MNPSEIAQMKNKLTEDIAVTISKAFGLRDYETGELYNALCTANFYEFWFPGRSHGSYKVYLNAQSVPYVYDQHQMAQNKEKVEKVNVSIIQLIKAYNDHFHSLYATAEV